MKAWECNDGRALMCLNSLVPGSVAYLLPTIKSPGRPQKLKYCGWPGLNFLRYERLYFFFGGTGGTGGAAGTGAIFPSTAPGALGARGADGGIGALDWKDW